MIQEIANLPDISFIGDISLDDIKTQMVSDYQKKFEEETGQTVTLKEGEPVALILYACATAIYQMYLNADKAGKMNFLKYAYGDYLDNLGALKGVTRKPEEPAVCTVRFTLSAARPAVVAIPQGTRVTTRSDGVYFATDNYAEIAAGSTYVDVPCTALTAGTAGNGIIVGDIDVLVDPIAYIESVANTTETSGGTEVEDDESLADRIYLAPESYSVAGPAAAYEYFVREAYSGVGDVLVSSPSECEVDIRVVGKNGELLSAEILQRIEDYINDEEIKPMTDQVTVDSPDTESDTVAFTYYIARSDAANVTAIQARVGQAVSDYIAWQTGKIGRDIEPQKLTEYVLAAGAKRVTITAPTQTTVAATEIAQITGTSITYGGLEDD